MAFQRSRPLIVETSNCQFYLPITFLDETLLCHILIMPRYCKICEEEFPTAAKLAEHLKLSDCSNLFTAIKCPYCNRDDFVDEDSLNRHLSQNRQCSRADIEATDKLSILAPDSSLTKHLKSDTQPENTPFKPTNISYVDTISQLEGNLVNVANAMGMQVMHQINTTLYPNPSSMPFVITLSTDYNNDGGVERQLKLLDKVITSKSVDVLILQNDDFAESDQQQQEQDVESFSIATSQSGSEDGIDEESSLHAPQETTEIDVVGAADGIEEPGQQEGEDHLNNLPYEAAMDNVPIVRHFHGGSPQLDCLAELYTMLDKRGVANSLFDKVTQWAWLNGPSFGRTPPMKRKKVVEKVFRHVRGDNYRQYMTPKQKILKLSTGRHVAVTYFPIEQMIKDLLCNSTLMRAENLLISDVNNPLNDTDNNASMSFGDVDSGSWWKKARENECKEARDMLWPLIMFIDGMKVDNLSGKLKLEPISFTFSRFRRWVRNQDNAWRTWAYMEEVKEALLPNEGENVILSAKERLQEYHDILRFLLKDLTTIQADGFPWILDLGTEQKHNVVLKMPLQFVIGDCEGHDKLVGRFKGHTMNIKGLCRDCDVPTDDSDDVHWLCHYFEEDAIQGLSEEELRQKSFYKIINGFDDVSVGGCTRGIRTLFNPEILHLFKSGHCEWISDGYTFTLSSKATEYTNKASAFLVLMNRGQSDRTFPEIGTFRDGLSKPKGTVLMGHEKHARLFFMYMLLCCSDYVSMLNHNQKRGHPYDLRFYKGFLRMLEHSLGFYEWSARREHIVNSIIGNDGTPESSQSQASIRRYLSLLKTWCPREVLGKNFKMTKFHQTLHLASAISRHGSLLNIDGSRPESMAKGNVKDPASHTQRISSSLSYQTGKRYIESLTFREYKRMKAEEEHDQQVDCYDCGGYINRETPEAKVVIPPRDDNNDEVPIYAAGTSFTLVLDLDQPDNEYAVYVHWTGKGKPTLGKFDEHLLGQLGKRLFGADDGVVVVDTEVEGCTSVVVRKNLYTAHPMFRNDHPWHDWVYIAWEGYDNPVPARIDMFIDLRNSEISNVTIENENDSNNTNSEGNPIPFQFFLEKNYMLWYGQGLAWSVPETSSRNIICPSN